MKNRHTDSDLAEFKNLIEQRITQVRTQIACLRGHLREELKNEDREVITELLGGQQRVLEGLQNSIIKIRHKAYGISIKDGSLISKERLLSSLHTSVKRAAQDAQQKEQEQKKSTGRLVELGSATGNPMLSDLVARSDSQMNYLSKQ